MSEFMVSGFFAHLLVLFDFGQMLQTAQGVAGNTFSLVITPPFIESNPRAKIEARVAKEKDIVVIFLESICNDPAVIAANVALKVSSGDPDYADFTREEAERDFLRRIRQYESVYETITEPHLSYLRITNVGSEVTLCHIHGYLQSRIAFYLMNLHLKPRSIYLSRVRAQIIVRYPTHLNDQARRESIQCRRQNWR